MTRWNARGRLALGLAVALFALLAVGSCKKEKQDAATTVVASGGTPVAASIDAAAPVADASAPPSDGMSGKGGKCPSLVAATTVAVVAAKAKGAATVRITSQDKNAVATILARASAWTQHKRADAGTPTHDGKGSQGGEDGHCVLATPGVEVVKVEKLADGVAVQVSFDPSRDLVAEMSKRAADGVAWVAANLKPEAGGQGGLGDGKGDHGRNHAGDGDGRGKEKPNAKVGKGAGGGAKDGKGGGDKKGQGGGAGTGGGGGAGTGGGGSQGTGGGGGAGTGGGGSAGTGGGSGAPKAGGN